MNPTIKPGWLTSEAHITIITIVGSALLSHIGLTDACKNEVITKVAPFITMGLASFGYAISRGIAKLKGSHDVTVAAATVPATPGSVPTSPMPPNT